MSDYNEIILHPDILKMFSEMEPVFKKFEIEFYLAGAFSRDIQFGLRQSKEKFRKTEDVDLAVFVNHENNYNELMEALVDTGLFERHEKEIIKLTYRSRIEIDLIPFGEIENEKREVRLTKPKVFTLQMPGFLEVFPFVDTINSGDLTLKTCPIEGLIMLKLISWSDRTHRTHDLTDIDNIIDAYFDWNVDEVFQFHYDIFEKYRDVEPALWENIISAHIIGRKMKLILESSPELKKRVLHILNKRENHRWEGLRNGLTE